MYYPHHVASKEWKVEPPALCAPSDKQRQQKKYKTAHIFFRGVHTLTEAVDHVLCAVRDESIEVRGAPLKTASPATKLSFLLIAFLLRYIRSHALGINSLDQERLALISSCSLTRDRREL